MPVLSGNGVRYDQTASSMTRSSRRTDQYCAFPLYGHVVVVSVGTSRSMRVSTFGTYQRAGNPVSNNTRGFVDSAITTPSTSTRTCRDEGRTSMRVYGL